MIAIMQKAWNDKMDLLINPEEADVIKLGGINVDEAVKKEIDGAVKREAEDRWRCGVTKCTKLFLEEKFVRSHIQKRHRDWLERLTLEVHSPFSDSNPRPNYSIDM
jgi:post-segregation antitoxin (ccd killing protein)